MQITIVIALLFVVVLGIFFGVRWHVRRAPAVRARTIAAGAALIALGFLCGVGLPALVPETRSSPATTVGIVVLYTIGSIFLLLGVPALLGAALARREPVEPAKKP